MRWTLPDGGILLLVAVRPPLNPDLLTGLVIGLALATWLERHGVESWAHRLAVARRDQ